MTLLDPEDIALTVEALRKFYGSGTRLGEMVQAKYLKAVESGDKEGIMRILKTVVRRNNENGARRLTSIQAVMLHGQLDFLNKKKE